MSILKGGVNSFWRNVITLLSASMLAQAIPFIILPILQKWFFSPEDFGKLAIYASVSTLLASVAAFKYELAIVNAKSQKEASNIFYGSIFIVLVFSFITTIVFNLFKSQLSIWLGVESIQSYLTLLNLSIIFLGLFEVFNYWNNRKKSFKTIAAAKVSKSIAAEGSKLGFGYSNILGGLIYGRIVGEFISMMYLVVKFFIYDFKNFTKSRNREILNTLKKYYRFPLFTMPSVFVGNFIYVIFFALFNKYFGEAKTGIIGISVTYVYAAFALLSASFSQVFLKEIHDIKGRDNLLKVYLKNAKLLALLSLFVTVFVLIIPSDWVVYLLGDKWNDMMPTLKILVFGFAVSFVTSSLSFIYIRLDKQKLMLIFDIFHLLLVWASITWAYNYFGTFKETLIVYTIAQVVYYVIAFIAAILFIKRSKI